MSDLHYFVHMLFGVAFTLMAQFLWKKAKDPLKEAYSSLKEKFFG
jgi:hypothetical protein